ncbi:MULTISPECIES: hypothetical protein [unclassified Streptomyces]|uniref:hypothetical protein n=1 Tax=unclassified Streptomyces TaxID=2593676 RepID=UPI00116276CF|nr:MULTISPECIES: hypothetical protein [unclassified Streptomyces]NMI58870.1 hypothetical protein [Streptomyces sp. RLA2-12]QDN58168.1 hypothetical protein FNV67_25110 [Streptomyces sp. S1D4-20]QDN68262.1 hypothetical protein FNV66_24300 [Streptomyces sp. S1D4-14]QDO50679.1 hypothetical protein FNV60_22565 [Streptomyces sp. RLB3-5]QDO60919.1 hypothetical protein FNV59_24805 [Streptomyces sp. RLB1-8]
MNGDKQPFEMVPVVSGEPGPDWVGWGREMRKLAEVFESGFERVHGFSPGEHEVELVSPEDGAEAVGGLAEIGVEGNLLAFYAELGAVTLPDLGNGIWIDDAASVTEGITAGYRPTELDGALKDSVVVFATDGGGAMFAVSATSGRVYRLSLGALAGSVYEVGDVGWAVVGEDLWTFLDRLRNDLIDAVRT